MDKVSGVKFSDILKLEVDDAKKSKETRTGSVFEDINDAFEENPDGISNDEFKQIFKDRFSLDDKKNDKLDALTAYISSLDKNDKDVTLQDIGTYCFAISIIDAAEGTDYSTEGIDKIVSIINKNLKNGDVSITDFANQVKKVINTRMNRTLETRIRNVVNKKRDQKFTVEDLEKYAVSTLNQYANETERELEKVDDEKKGIKPETTRRHRR